MVSIPSVRCLTPAHNYWPSQELKTAYWGQTSDRKGAKIRTFCIHPIHSPSLCIEQVIGGCSLERNSICPLSKARSQLLGVWPIESNSLFLATI